MATRKTQDVDSNGSDQELEVRPLRTDDWPYVEQLFGANGACGGCWCMWWRVERGGKLWAEVKGEKNKLAMKRAVENGKIHAMLAIASGGAPVGWCSFGPRESFPRLLRARSLNRKDADSGTWSIVCFFIPAKWRGKGVASQLLDAATTRAFELGADEVEGFPAVPKQPGKAVPAAFAWTGVPSLFENHGFQRLEREADARPIYVHRRKDVPA